MKKKLAGKIVKYRYLILIIMLAAAVWSVFQIPKTRINYDLTRYLSDSTMTKRALIVMEEEFGTTEQLSMVFEVPDDETVLSYAEQLRKMEELRLVQYDPETDIARQDGHTYRRLTLTLGDCDSSALVDTLRGMFPDAQTCWVGGPAAEQLDVQRSIGDEIPAVMAIAVGIVFLVLLLTSHAWLEPLVLLVIFALSILINMGTNFLFPDVSFITFAVCAILQLALSIDYAVMLLHTWNGLCDTGLDAEEAMTEALAQCFMRIAASALTTIAGLLSLLFMSFTIGFDIGLVLSKGILISMLGVFLLMPSLTLLLRKPLRKTRHTPVRLGGEHLGSLIWKARRPLALLLTLLVCIGAFLNSGNTYSFMENNTLKDDDTGRIAALYGVSNPLVLLVPSGETDEDFDLQRDLVSRLLSLRREDGSPVLESVNAMVTDGADALRSYTPAEVAELTGMEENLIYFFFVMNDFGDSVQAGRLLEAAEPYAGDNEILAGLKSQLEIAREIFIGKNYHRLILNPAFSGTDSDLNVCMEAVFAEAEKSYGDTWYATGGPMSTYDIGNAFRGDLMKVNLITLFAILLIVVLSFRAFLLPLLLVFVIEGAIWITMGLSRLLGQPIFFISYLICLSIQMGATIDYGILLCDQYRALRRGGAESRDALREALGRALPTILTSGLILITAGFVIGKQCSIYYISSIGLLISRGACFSVLLVLSLLPALLALFDRRIFRSGKGGRP